MKLEDKIHLQDIKSRRYLVTWENGFKEVRDIFFLKDEGVFDVSEVQKILSLKIGESHLFRDIKLIRKQ